MGVHQVRPANAHGLEQIVGQPIDQNDAVGLRVNRLDRFKQLDILRSLEFVQGREPFDFHSQNIFDGRAETGFGGVGGFEQGIGGACFGQLGPEGMQQNNGVCR
jgi:hypothetical protein